MTKKTSKPKARRRKGGELRLEKETLKDLTAKDAGARDAKGGFIANPNPGRSAATYCDTCQP